MFVCSRWDVVDRRALEHTGKGIGTTTDDPLLPPLDHAYPLDGQTTVALDRGRPGGSPPISGMRQVYFLYRLTNPEAIVLFEFDDAKSRSNRAKHGIDFLEAQALWLDDMLIEIVARTVDEPRYLVVGLIEDKHWSAVITYREDRIRIISVRRSRDEEVALYEGG